jgi:hypothetical protein
MTTIILPPLPSIYENHAGKWIDVDDVRARDLAVAKAVLEGAALKCEGERRLGIDDERAYYGDLMAEAIRNIEVKHHI